MLKLAIVTIVGLLLNTPAVFAAGVITDSAALKCELVDQAIKDAKDKKEAEFKGNSNSQDATDSAVKAIKAN